MKIHMKRTTKTNSLHVSRALLVKRLMLWSAFITLVTLTACARVAPRGPQESFREISAPELSDDQDLKGLSEAIKLQLEVLGRSADTVMQFGPITTTRGTYASALEKLLTQLNSSASSDEIFNYIRDKFRFFEYFGGKRWGEVLLTSYFEPMIPASRRPTATFSRALLAKPTDLLTIPLAQFSTRFSEEKPLKGRLQGTRVVPYYTREEIDGALRLRDQKLELAWVDPIDAFFLHIQGSGTVRYEDGAEEHLVYADKNGHRYEAIGAFLKERIAPKKVTMQRLEALLRTMSPGERDSILFRNPSYVFFSKSPKRAITSLGVPATPGRTIATDPRFAPKGAIGFLEFHKPIISSKALEHEGEHQLAKAARFVVDQDTGGAITGTGRVDLFWGRGDEAKEHAGLMQDAAHLTYLVPRD
jgi:membrane-bound lytic murein transglycosylase A